MRLNAVITREARWYVARCLEVHAAAQGETAEKATENLREALTFADTGHVVPAESAVVTTIEVPDPAPSAREDERPYVDQLVLSAERAGWTVIRDSSRVVLRAPDGDRVASFPLVAERVAHGVYRVVAPPRVARGDAAAALGQLDELFARHPHTDDTTRLVREQRDDA